MAKEQSYIILSDDGLHEYNIVVEQTKKGTKFSLYRSEGEQWREQAKGELIMAMTNNGNGVKFDRKLKNLDFSELLYVRILVNFEHQTDKNPKNRLKYRVIENKATIEL